MAAVDSQTSEISDNNSNHVDENRNDNKTRRSENADISANGNEEEDADESDVENEEKKEEPEREATEEEKSYVFGVKKITDFKVQDGTRFYKVQWADTWEPEHNLHGCKDLIDEFLEKRKKEKGSIEEEDSAHKGGYCLREKSVVNKKKRKGHGWSSTTTKRMKQKRRRALNTPSSADVSEYSGQSDHSEDGPPPVKQQLGILSPQQQDAIKNMRNRKRVNQKRKKMNNFLNGINDFDSDNHTPVQSQDERLASPMDETNHVEYTPQENNVPSNQTIPPVEGPHDDTVAMSGSDVSTPPNTSTVTTVVSTCSMTTTSTVTVTTDTANVLSSWQKSNTTTKRNPILLGDDDSDGEKETPNIVEEVKVKEEPVSGDEKEEEILFKRTAKLKASYVIRRLCESGDILSGEEGEEEQDLETFRPDPRLNAPFVIRQEDDEDDSSSQINNEIPAGVWPTSDKLIADLPLPVPSPMNMGAPPFPYDRTTGTASNADKTPPTINTAPNISMIRPVRLESANTTPRHTTPSIPVTPRHTTPSIPVTPRHTTPSIPVTPRHTTPSVHATPRPTTPSVHVTPRPTNPSLKLRFHDQTKKMEKNASLSRSPIQQNNKGEGSSHVIQNPPGGILIQDVKTTKPPDDDDDDDEISITGVKDAKKSDPKTPLGTPVFPPRFNNNVRQPTPLPTKLEIPLQCNIPIKYLPNHYVEAMISRILFHVKKLIQTFQLQPGALQDWVQPLITKSVVQTVQESYKFDTNDYKFLQNQVNDLAQIAVKELPYGRLMELLYSHPHTPNSVLNHSANKDININITLASAVLSKTASPLTSTNTDKQSSNVSIPEATVFGTGMTTARPAAATALRPIFTSNVRGIVPTVMSGAPAPVSMSGAPVAMTGAPVSMTGAPVVMTGAPVVITGAPVAMSGAPVHITPMIFSQFPMRHPPPGYIHHPVRFVPTPNMDPTRVPFNIIVPRPETVNLVSSGIRPVSISQLRPVNRLPNTSSRVPNPVTTDNRLPSTPISNLHHTTRLPTSSVRMSPRVRAPNTNSSLPKSSVGVPLHVSPPPLNIINSVSRLTTTETNTSLPCSITNVRSLKVIEPDIEPLVESIDIHDDDNGDKNKSVSSSATSSLTPKVKTVLGPHRFYKPPKKKSESRGGVNGSSTPSEVTGKLNLVKKREKIRYKDLVNQKFAAKPAVPTCDKVVDLTDLDADTASDDAVVSLDDSDVDEKSEEEMKNDEKSDEEMKNDEKGDEETKNDEKSDDETKNDEKSDDETKSDEKIDEKSDEETKSDEKIDEKSDEEIKSDEKGDEKSDEEMKTGEKSDEEMKTCEKSDEEMKSDEETKSDEKIDEKSEEEKSDKEVPSEKEEETSLS